MFISTKTALGIKRKEGIDIEIGNKEEDQDYMQIDKYYLGNEFGNRQTVIYSG